MPTGASRVFAIATLLTSVLLGSAGSPDAAESDEPKATLYLTFDDGPDLDTRVVLDALDEQSLKATFFVNASARNMNKPENQEKQRALLREILAKGHTIGNHCLDHGEVPNLKWYQDKFGGLKTDKQRSAFAKFVRGNEDYFGAQSIPMSGENFRFDLVRLPGEGRNVKEAVDWLAANKFMLVNWSAEFRPKAVASGQRWEVDWQGVKGVACDPRGFSKGGIALLHDHHWGDHKDALSVLLRKLKERFVVEPYRPPRR